MPRKMAMYASWSNQTFLIDLILDKKKSIYDKDDGTSFVPLAAK